MLKKLFCLMLSVFIPFCLCAKEEKINDITVNWSPEVTSKQKSEIKNLIKNLILVVGGNFMMGSKEADAEEDEKPAHKEFVNTFRIGKYEVTQKLWEAIMGYNPSYFKGEKLPVESVTWNECYEFINKLNSLTGLNFRLPTESEWEYAAKGGLKSKGYIYSGSNLVDEVGWYNKNADKETHPVGSKQPNELGIYDMTGNVWEWTSDNYSSNYTSARNTPINVRRGGSVNNQAWRTRVTFRGSYEPYSRERYLGLRLVL